MKLIGYYDSPYVRRVGITLKIYDMPFDHVPLATVPDRQAIKNYSPMGRIPALVLDEGEVLVESSIIIDYLNEIAGPARTLTPTSGAERRRVMAIVGWALGVTDKYVAAYYEITKRPAGHVWHPWRDHLEDQVGSGLAALEGAIEGPRFFGAAITQAEVTLVAAVESMRLDMQHLAPIGRYPKLDRLIQSVEMLDAFVSTRPHP